MVLCWTDDARLSRLGPIPTCLFGPGDIAVAHSANEYVEIRDVLRASEVYRSVIMNHCSQSVQVLRPFKLYQYASFHHTVFLSLKY